MDNFYRISYKKSTIIYVRYKEREKENSRESRKITKIDAEIRVIDQYLKEN